MSGKSAKIYANKIRKLGLTEEDVEILGFLIDQETPSASQTPREEYPIRVPSAPLRAPNLNCLILTSQGLSPNGEVLTMTVSSEEPRNNSGKCRHDIEAEPSNLWDRDGFNSESASDDGSDY